MSEMIVLGGRRRGRPPATVPRSQVTVTMPDALYDRLASIALSQRVSMSRVICRVVAQALADDGIKKPNNND